MAKKKINKTATPLVPAPQPGSDFLHGSIKSIHKTECVVCQHDDDTDDMTIEDFAQHLHDEGWRIDASKKFDVEGIMCPRCAKTPDNLRTDDDSEDEEEDRNDMMRHTGDDDDEDEDDDDDDGDDRIDDDY